MGVGLWWPGRSYLSQPLSQLEKHFVEKEKENLEGVKFWGCMKGYRGSSTRAEIAAIAIALMSNVPVHIATDSANSKTSLDTLLEDLRNKEIQCEDEWHYEEWPMKEQWTLIKDGDLWHKI